MLAERVGPWLLTTHEHRGPQHSLHLVLKKPTSSQADHNFTMGRTTGSQQATFVRLLLRAGHDHWQWDMARQGLLPLPRGKSGKTQETHEYQQQHNYPAQEDTVVNNSSEDWPISCAGDSSRAVFELSLILSELFSDTSSCPNCPHSCKQLQKISLFDQARLRRNCFFGLLMPFLSHVNRNRHLQKSHHPTQTQGFRPVLSPYGDSTYEGFHKHRMANICYKDQIQFPVPNFPKLFCTDRDISKDSTGRKLWLERATRGTTGSWALTETYTKLKKFCFREQGDKSAVKAFAKKAWRPIQIPRTHVNSRWALPSEEGNRDP